MKEKANVNQNRSIRRLTLSDVEGYLEVYLNAYPAYKELDDECLEKYRKKATLEISENKEVIHMGMFEGDKVIGIMKVVHFSLNLFGEIQPALGLMALGVHPLYKKQGIALAMIREFEKIAIEEGATVTMLLPFNIPFYRRMGYGFGGRLEEYHIPTTGLPKAEPDAMEHIRFLSLEDLPAVLKCHRTFVRANHGMVDKFEEEIRGMEADSQVFRVGYEEDGQLRGYLAWRYRETSDVNYTQVCMSVEEMVYENGKILRAMLGFVRNQADLCQTVLLRSGEPDFLHLLEDPQDISKNYIDFGFLQTNVAAVGTMFKLVNPKKFIADTGYRKFPEPWANTKGKCNKNGKFTVGFQYEKELEHREERVFITFENGAWTNAKHEEADVTVTLRQGTFASVLMGSVDISAMLRLGGAEISDGEKLPVLEALLAYPQRPWCNSDY